MTDPGGEAAEGLAVEAYVGDTRCNAGEPVATYRALEDGPAVTRYYTSPGSGPRIPMTRGCRRSPGASRRYARIAGSGGPPGSDVDN